MSFVMLTTFADMHHCYADFMFRALIDTSVWLSLARERDGPVVLDIVDEMIRLKMLEIIVPRIVFDEFKRNKERVGQESTRSLNSHSGSSGMS